MYYPPESNSPTGLPRLPSEVERLVPTHKLIPAHPLRVKVEARPATLAVHGPAAGGVNFAVPQP